MFLVCKWLVINYCDCVLLFFINIICLMVLKLKGFCKWLVFSLVFKLLVYLGLGYLILFGKVMEIVNIGDIKDIF